MSSSPVHLVSSRMLVGVFLLLLVGCPRQYSHGTSQQMHEDARRRVVWHVALTRDEVATLVSVEGLLLCERELEAGASRCETRLADCVALTVLGRDKAELRVFPESCEGALPARTWKVQNAEGAQVEVSF